MTMNEKTFFYKKSLTELNREELFKIVENRKSVRRFSNTKVNPQILDDILNTASEITPLLNDSVRFILLDKDLMKLYAGRLYNTFISAPHHLVCIAKTGNDNFCNAGYIKEALVLKATLHQIATCWVGGFVDEDKLATYLQIGKDERIISLCPLGYPSEQFWNGQVNKVFNSVSHSKDIKKRLPLNKIVFYKKPGRNVDEFLETNPVLKTAFDAARLAPSWRNNQPWRFLIQDKTIWAYLDDDQNGGSGERDGINYAYVDVGIAMFHVFILLHSQKIMGNWKLCDNSEKPQNIFSENQNPIALYNFA